ncbi:unnamed protein product, partial [Mesorhabditis belari]|uniref:Trafficking protein particle complex subunit n=1 Tax=Mesorhabditis belari TaxID=2138241 RepID=A0AAF3EUK6_9BILA
MAVQQVFVISRAGSLIYEWSQGFEQTNGGAEVERSFEWPLSIQMESLDGKAVVVWSGGREGIPNRYSVITVNGCPVSGTHFHHMEQRHNVFEYLSRPENFPLRLAFSPPSISTNEKIILSSTFHSLFTIAVQLSPVANSSGIEVLETSQFRLHCLQSRTGVKFVVVTSIAGNSQISQFLNKLYELYADFALKNPFYSIDMPIRCQKFDDGLKALLDRTGKPSAVTV